MERKTYKLMVEAVDPIGNIEKFPILEEEIETIDKYVSMFSNDKDLLNNNKKIQINDESENPFKFILNNFKNINIYIEDENHNKIESLYSDNRDVVYIDTTKNIDIENIVNNLCMSVGEFNTAHLKSFTEKDIKEIELFKTKYNFFKDTKDKIEKRNKKLIDTIIDVKLPDIEPYRSEKIIELISDKKNIKMILAESRRTPLLKRELLLDIKKVLKKLDDIYSKNLFGEVTNTTKTRLITKEESINRMKNETIDFGGVISKMITKEQENLKSKYNNSFEKVFDVNYVDKDIKKNASISPIFDNLLTVNEKYVYAKENGEMDEFLCFYSIDDVSDYVLAGNYKLVNGKIVRDFKFLNNEKQDQINKKGYLNETLTVDEEFVHAKENGEMDDFLRYHSIDEVSSDVLSGNYSTDHGRIIYKSKSYIKK